VPEVRRPHRTLLPDPGGSEHQKPTALQGRANKAQTQQPPRFRDWDRCFNAALVLDGWHDRNTQAARGVDNVTAEVYAVNLHANIDALGQRLNTKRDRAKLGRRCDIPKENGKESPLGSPTLAEQRVQLAGATLRPAIYEPDFLAGRYGYRPGRGAVEAGRDLPFDLPYGRYGSVVEADVHGCFDHVDHPGLLDLLRVRSEDRAFLHLLQTWLQAGILDRKGQGIHSETGTPQGGTGAPVLANG
jgi:retron-type reverse transcriptase